MSALGSGSNAHSGLNFPQAGLRRGGAFPPTHPGQQNKQPSPHAGSPYQSQAYPPQQHQGGYTQHLFNTSTPVNGNVGNGPSRTPNMPNALGVQQQQRRAAPPRQQMPGQHNPPPMMFPGSMSHQVQHDSMMSQQHHQQQQQQQHAVHPGHQSHQQQQQHPGHPSHPGHQQHQQQHQQHPGHNVHPGQHGQQQHQAHMTTLQRNPSMQSHTQHQQQMHQQQTHQQHQQHQQVQQHQQPQQHHQQQQQQQTPQPQTPVPPPAQQMTQSKSQTKSQQKTQRVQSTPQQQTQTLPQAAAVNGDDMDMDNGDGDGDASLDKLNNDSYVPTQPMGEMMSPPPEGGSYPTLEAVKKAVLRYCTSVGYAIVIGRSKKTGAGLKKVLFVCDRAGKPPSRVNPEFRKRKTSSRKCDCPFGFFAIEQRMQWTIRYRPEPAHLTHNHGPSEGPSDHPAARKLDSKMVAAVKQLKESGTSVPDTLQILQNENPECHLLRRDIYNARAAINRNPEKIAAGIAENQPAIYNKTPTGGEDSIRAELRRELSKARDDLKRVEDAKQKEIDELKVKLEEKEQLIKKFETFIDICNQRVIIQRERLSGQDGSQQSIGSLG